MNFLHLPKKDPRLSWPELKLVRRVGAALYWPLEDER
jgi:hypothetical protein